MGREDVLFFYCRQREKKSRLYRPTVLFLSYKKFPFIDVGSGIKRSKYFYILAYEVFNSSRKYNLV